MTNSKHWSTLLWVSAVHVRLVGVRFLTSLVYHLFFVSNQFPFVMNGQRVPLRSWVSSRCSQEHSNFQPIVLDNWVAGLKGMLRPCVLRNTWRLEWRTLTSNNEGEESISWVGRSWAYTNVTAWEWVLTQTLPDSLVLSSLEYWFSDSPQRNVHPTTSEYISPNCSNQEQDLVNYFITRSDRCIFLIVKWYLHELFRELPKLVLTLHICRNYSKKH